MILVIALAGLVYICSAQYGERARQDLNYDAYAQAPAQYPYYSYQQVYFKPIQLPELRAPDEFLLPRRFHHHRSSSSKSEEHRHKYRKCHQIISACLVVVTKSVCMSADIEYEGENGGQRLAKISCGTTENYTMKNSYGQTLGSGVGLSTIAVCGNDGYWRSKDENGEVIRIRAVGCFKKLPPPPPHHHHHRKRKSSSDSRDHSRPREEEAHASQCESGVDADAKCVAQ